MSFHVTIKPGNHSFTVHDDETILEAALREGLVIAYGCRTGACGSCKGKVLAGRVDYGDYQEHVLPDAEKAVGCALFCKARPLSDLEIECREISAAKDVPIRSMPARVQKIERPTDDVVIVNLKLPVSERLRFLAGQYIDILLKEGKRRSFSLANPPHDNTFLQLHIRNYGGSFSEYVFTRMKEKDILRFEGPLGTFFLREDSERPILLLASGTGFAPIKAIVEHFWSKRVERPITLYWGGRVRRDLYLADLPHRWASEHPDFDYIPVLSEPRADDGWDGRTGLVHQAALDDFADLSDYQVYACGNPLMVEAAQHDFTTLRGLPPEQFYSDAFTPSVVPATQTLDTP
jgi:CDP-4-dehydro-6-deoxyglucose reductase